ncbi:hypothetical protein R5R35_007009 [Gryllus longicercus]|uniref:Uncharacterized protein n=1 Tax=Gryllus longicercus TaxID=2509291 RepID=A0AAN9WI54_9ORTH
MRVMADDDMIEETNQPQDIHDSPEDDFDEESDDSEEDFESLNLQLDQLNSALDELEQKNDDIHAQLILLLQSNREARQQIQDSLKDQVPS